MMGNWGFFGMSMMWLVWLPLVALFVWFIIRITRNNENSQSAGRNAVDILKEKFAEGEISKEEFEEELKFIEKNTTKQGPETWHKDEMKATSLCQPPGLERIWANDLDMS